MQDKEQKLQETKERVQAITESIEATPEKTPIEPQLSKTTTEDSTGVSKPGSSPSEVPEKAENLSTADETNRVAENIDTPSAKTTRDLDNESKHTVSIPDYHAMPMEKLVDELQRLMKKEDLQAIGKQVSALKREFGQKFQALLEQKKEEFIADGGDPIDFHYNSTIKKQFDEAFTVYRQKRNQYYEQREQTLKSNLQKRLALIEQLKGLMDVEENIQTTYKTFKELQERWRNTGPVPRSHYNDVWRTYHHHVEIFYDFLQLNRELRDLDFKHNLEEKLKLVARAEALAQEPDVPKASRELQVLHKIWKEDIGPVAKEHRDAVWERFSKATRVIHQRRQEYFQEMETVYEDNLKQKEEIIASLRILADTVADNHKDLQQQTSQVEALREAFFKAGKVPQKVKEQTWAAFKDAVRKFNSGKNTFYKTQKKEQQHNLEKKKALLAVALSFKDSEDWEKATPEMKRIQSEWKKIGLVPKKEANTIWNEFKTACNAYFDRLHAVKNESQKEEYQNFEKKKACLERLKAFQLSGDAEKDLATLKAFLAEWKQYGHVPYNKKHINGKFNKIVDVLFKKIGISQQQVALLKYGDKVQRLAHTDDIHALSNEQTFIKRKIEESKAEIRQLENNLQFFSNASESSPLVKKVVNHIAKQKEILETWKAKLKKLSSLEQSHNTAIEKNTDEEA